MPANFKTYEAQARLMAALVAAHPELKLNYKAIAQNYGKSQTVSAMEHRFRPIREQAKAIRSLVSRDMDPEQLDIFDKHAMAELFGDSTPDGIQFQFRSIKSSADALKNAVENGEDPVAAFNAGKASASSTPTGRRKATPRKRGRPATATAATPSPAKSRSVALGSGGASTSKPKRKVTQVKYTESSDKDDSPADYDELDSSPTKQIKKVRTTPIKTQLPSREEFVAQARMAASAAGFAPSGFVAGHAATRANDHTSPSDISVATPENASDEVMFVKEEAVNTAVSNFPPFSQPASSFASQGTSLIGGDSGAAFSQPSASFSSQAPRVHQSTANAAQPDPVKLAEAQAQMQQAFGGTDVDWTMSNFDLLSGQLYDNGEI